MTKEQSRYKFRQKLISVGGKEVTLSKGLGKRQDIL